MKRSVARILFFIGWVLSPLTFWNDAFINIPISYLCANITISFFKADLLLVVLVFYWVSNLLGLLMMYMAGRGVVHDKKELLREIAIFIATVIIYSILIVFLARIGVIKPVNIIK
ncbi:MAG: hypothetical protein WC592_07965 [Candidatus Omnitrophota bacterium]|nr:hypothetical protein [Candidatus Omnitrophota bacterium]